MELMVRIPEGAQLDAPLKQVGARVLASGESVPGAVRAEQWPGIRPRDPSKASASEQPWIDANSYLVALERALHPERTAILDYQPDEKAGVSKDRVLPYHGVELALAETRMAGGNAVLTIPKNYADALAVGEGRATAAWKSLAATVAFLREHEADYARPVGTRVAVLANSMEHHGELLNMMYRRNVAPAVFAPKAAPAFGVYRFLVAVGVPEAHQAVHAFAFAGGTVLAAPVSEKEPLWWIPGGARRKKSDDERNFFTWGKGGIIGYREPILDPAEFALDVLDAEGWTGRDVRLVAAESAIAIPHRLEGNQLSVELIHYGTRQQEDFMMRVEGAYSAATLRAPGAEPRKLKCWRQGSGTEMEVPGVARVASILVV